MKLKYLLSAASIVIVIFAAVANSKDYPQKIRSRFTIQDSYCAIKTNGVLGFNNRDEAKSANRESTSAISSTNAMMMMENGENEISLEIGALGWFSKKLTNISERDNFLPKAGCSLDLIHFTKQKENILSSIKVAINPQGIPEAQTDNVHPITRKEIQGEQAEPGFIDPDYFSETLYPKGMKLYQFTQKITIKGIPDWVWTRATPYTGNDGQLDKLKEAYSEMSEIISSGDRSRLKSFNKEALKAWPSTTGDSEDDILLSLYPREKLEGKKVRMQPIKWENYSIRIMNKGRMVQLYNKSEPTYSPLTYRITYEDGDELLGYFGPIFSLIDGKFIPVI